LEIIAAVIHLHPISFRGYSIYTKDLEEELMYLKTFTQTNHVLYPALLKIFNLPSMSRPLSVQKRTRLRPCSVCATHSNSILYPPLQNIYPFYLWLFSLCPKNASDQAHDWSAPLSNYVPSPSCSNKTGQYSMALSLLCPKLPAPQPMKRLCHFIASINTCLEMADANLYTTQQSKTSRPHYVWGSISQSNIDMTSFYHLNISKILLLTHMWSRATSKDAMITPCVCVCLFERKRPFILNQKPTVR
jgi:hypothetical protein